MSADNIKREICIGRVFSMKVTQPGLLKPGVMNHRGARMALSGGTHMINGSEERAPNLTFILPLGKVLFGDAG